MWAVIRRHLSSFALRVGRERVELVHTFINLIRSRFGCRGSPEGSLTSHLYWKSPPPLGRAISRRSRYHLAMPPMSDDLTSILANAGGVP